MGFVDRQYLYQKQTMSESYDQLRRRNEELQNIVGESKPKDSKAASRVSWRNTVEIKEYLDSEEEEVNYQIYNGFIIKICFRNQVSSIRLRMYLVVEIEKNLLVIVRYLLKNESIEILNN